MTDAILFLFLEMSAQIHAMGSIDRLNHSWHLLPVAYRFCKKKELRWAAPLVVGGVSYHANTKYLRTVSTTSHVPFMPGSMMNLSPAFRWIGSLPSGVMMQ